MDNWEDWDIDEITEENNPHPLIIDIVVAKVLGYLAKEDLQTCRQVCQKWEEFATPLLTLQLPVIEFYGGGHYGLGRYPANCRHWPKYPSPPRKLELGKLPFYLAYLGGSVHRQFKKDKNAKFYKAKSASKSENLPAIVPTRIKFYRIDVGNRIVQEFLKDFGYTITELHLNFPQPKELYQHSHHEEGIDPKILHALLKTQCPNLTLLGIHSLPDNILENGFQTGDIFQTKITDGLNLSDPPPKSSIL